MLDFDDSETDEKHKKVSGIILEDYGRKNFIAMEANIIRVALIRRF